MYLLGVVLCEESIAHIFGAWKIFLDPDSGKRKIQLFSEASSRSENEQNQFLAYENPYIEPITKQILPWDSNPRLSRPKTISYLLDDTSS